MSNPLSQKTNRLSLETSPYLKQHAHNPVDWYPWGEEALTRSQKEQKPIFLSIGYSACHWCHVMERESFEDEETAKILNAHFISIKVDREERPDLDHIYMSAVQLMTQHGGWPMSVFLTPNLQPFYGGTYFPPEDRMGLPSFKKILLGVAGAWRERKNEVTKSAEDLTEAIRELSQSTEKESGALSTSLITKSIDSLSQSFDSGYGGFGSSPKFFHTLALRVCLREWSRSGNANALKMVDETLENLSRGGIYDQLGGGFHRYSTDRIWLVPHFEKMLYDNALLAHLYLERIHASTRSSGGPGYSKLIRDTLDFVLREMTTPEGVFYSTQDADSEGEEGKYYVWTENEIRQTLGKELGDYFCLAFNVVPQGNWENANILHRKLSWEQIASNLKLDRNELEDQMAVATRKLMTVRDRRVKPGTDRKALVSWNGMMIESLAYASMVFEDDETYLQAAIKAGRFILSNMWDQKTGLLLHSWMDGKARFNAYLDDYAALANAFLTLYEATFDWSWIEEAKKICECIRNEFWDKSAKSFFFTATRHERLLIRPKDEHDGATPSGAALATTAFVRLGRITDETGFTSIARDCLESNLALMERAPMGAGQFLIALDYLEGKGEELVIVSGQSQDEFEDVARSLRRHFSPGRLIAAVGPSNTMVPLFRGKTSLNSKTTLYPCRQGSCGTPIVGLEAIESFLASSK